MWTAIGFGVIAFALIVALLAVFSGRTDGMNGDSGLKVKDEPRNKTMI